MKPPLLLPLGLLALPTLAHARQRQAGCPDILTESARSLLGGPYPPVALRYALLLQQEAGARYQQQRQKP